VSPGPAKGAVLIAWLLVEPLKKRRNPAGFVSYAGRYPARRRDETGPIDMKRKNKHQHAVGEVTELARETAKVEQYWIVGDRSEPRKPSKKYNYVEELVHL